MKKIILTLIGLVFIIGVGLSYFGDTGQFATLIQGLFDGQETWIQSQPLHP